MDRYSPALKGVAQELARTIKAGEVVGLGSGSTVAGLLENLAPIALAKSKAFNGVPTSSQIELVAKRNGITLVPFPGSVDLAIDGADQVDENLNLIKGGGGALLREKVLMGSAKRIVVVASDGKFARKLCENGVKVPIEVVPMARESAKLSLSKLGGVPEERMLPKGYPFFTENGNIILDTMFEPLDDPEEFESRVKKVPGVAEVGVFTFKPITVYRIRDDGTFDALKFPD